MKKVLFVATVVKTHINAFHLPFLKMFKENGWETDVCAKNDFENPEDCNIPHCDKFFDTPFERFPFKPNNIKAFFALRKLIKREQYDIIHCHTPSGGVLARLAAIGTKKKGCRVMYTAHGFHFFKSAPMLNWLIYCPIEWVCSFFTDTLITINKEDYAFAKKHMHAKEIEYVPGVGINTQKFNVCCDTAEKRASLGLPDDATLLLSVGELSTRKNHRVIIEALAKLNDENVHYLIVGRGDKKEELEALANSLGLGNRVHLLGFRSDIPELCHTADIFCFPSIHEGLPVALMEAMASGLPCVASDIRGNTDLIENGKNGFLCKHTDVEAFAEKIKELITNLILRHKIAQDASEVVKKFDIENICREMNRIYFI